MKKSKAKNGSNNKTKKNASVLPLTPHPLSASDLKNSQHRGPKEKKALRPTENQLKVIRRYGIAILSEIAYGIRDKCRSPFCPDGNLTKDGLEAAKEIVDNLFYVYGDERFFDQVTEDVLRTFGEFFDHDPGYGNDDVDESTPIRAQNVISLRL
jgi:hypothetical protein